MKAWELLEKKDWCQGAYAKNAIGENVEPTSPNACSFCIVGLLHATYPVWKVHPLLQNLRNHSRIMGRVPEWNDHPSRTKEEVLTVLKELDI